MPIWKPNNTNNQMLAFIKFLQKHYSFAGDDYASLHQWSIVHKDFFWQAISDFFHIEWMRKADFVFQPNEVFFKGKWFEDAQLNFAKQLLRHRGSRIAIHSYNEHGLQKSLTFDELYQEVASLVLFLKNQGVVQGDRVVGILSNTHHPICAMLACSVIGAIWASCSPDFGELAIIDRFSQIEPKCLLTVSEHEYHGKVFKHHQKIENVLKAIPSIQTLIWIDKQENGFCWEDLLQKKPLQIDFSHLDFNHPLFILFSSGTTGRPKCIVHRAGGVLLQHLKELGLHTNLTDKDKLLFFTTCAWMMWNWMASALALGTTLVLYDGSPVYPNDTHLLEILEETQTTVFGASPAYFSGLEKKDIRYQGNLKLLKTILSTGATLMDFQYDYIQKLFSPTIQISSISGGSDIVSCFALGNPMLPVYRGELQCVGLGMDVAVYNENAEAILNEKGELVCRSPFPSMPLGFWNDHNDERYYQSYFARFKNIWTHGDFAKMTPHGGIIIYGRSDATLNPQGVRIGTAELYRVVQKVPGILDCVAVSQDWQNDTRIVLFVQLKEGLNWSKDLQNQIILMIKTQLSPRHVPAKILSVRDIPRTMNGKMMETTVRKLVNGETIDNLSVIVNPECLKDYQNREELCC